MYQHFFKRLFDIVGSLIMLPFVLIEIIILAPIIHFTDKGPVFYNALRASKNYKPYKMFKLRSMYVNSPNLKNPDGRTYNSDDDPRVTPIGRIMRKTSLDEFPQMLNVLLGDMSFVGTRPEVVKYVKAYTPEFYATLLMPAGITSEASIRYKHEYELLTASDDVDKTYMEEVLPAKMVWNLNSVERFSFPREILTMFRTVAAVLGTDYK